MNSISKFFVVSLLFGTFSLIAQTKIISGTVTDNNGQPLPGVSVIIDGKSIGTTTNFDGKYSINVSDQNSSLNFSYIGFKSSSLIAENGTLDVSLQPDLLGLDEVIVVGYGTAKKSDLTGAVSSVTGDDLLKAASNRPVEAIQGRVAGMNITKSSGRPGAGLKVRIRGIGSTNNSDPLYVVDGVPAGNDIDYLAPEDIKSIEVLKDASATAIYGNKGANGVVIVTTKSGQSLNKTEFNYSSYIGFAQAANTIDVLDAKDQATLILEAAGNDGISIPSSLNTRINYVLTNNSSGNNWQDLIFRDATQVNHYFGARGGLKTKEDASINYNLSATYFDEEGIVENTDFKKYIFNSRVEYQFNSNVRAGIHFDLFNKENGNFSEGIYDGPIPLALTTSPMDRGMNDAGELINTGTAFGLNPLLPIEHQKYSNNSTKSLGLRTWLDIDIAAGLSFSTTFKISSGFNHNKAYRPAYYLSENFNRAESELYDGRGEWLGYTSINVFNYNKTFAENHRLIATLGAEHSFYESDFFSGTGLNVPVEEALQYLNLATAYKEQLGAYQGQNGTESYFARAFYSFKDKYMFTGTVRYDGSSKFSGDNKWGVFPSFGTSWVLSEEQFVKDLGVFSQLKLRAGWGRVGNEASAQAGSDVANINNYAMFYVFNNTQYQGGTTTNIPTPDLKWEIIETTNIGLDAGFLDGNLKVTADYFIKDTNDMITRVSLPGYYPKDRPNANIGKMSNKGFEFATSYQNSIGNVNFNVGANISLVQNEVVKLNSESSAFIDGGYIDKLGYTTRTEAGEEIAYFYGYETNGIFRSDEELAANNGVQPNARVGDVRFVDRNGNDEIDAGDRTNLGSAVPDYTLGFNFALDYKGFDFSANIYAVQGVDLVNGMSLRLLEVNDYFNAYSSRMDRFHPTNNPTGTQPRVTLSDSNNNLRFSDRYVEDGSFIRLKNIQLGYTFDNGWTEKANIESLRLYVSGQNLFTFTDYSGFDPEVGDLTHDADGDVRSLGIGVDLGNYPQPRLLYVGLNLKF